MIEKIKSLIKSFSQRKLKRYEVMSLMSHAKCVDEVLKNAQDEGWEIGGEILLKNEDGWCGSTYFHIPMKRRVN